MKAIAVLQFYFPYVLPRADDWPSGHIGFQFPEFTVGLHPRNPDEELFPHEIDKNLSTMELRLGLSLPTGLTSLTVREQCHDRIEVRVHGEIDSLNDAKRDDIQEMFRDVAVRVTFSSTIAVSQPALHSLTESRGVTALKVGVLLF